MDPSQQPDIDAPALDAPQGNADAKATDGAPSALSAQQKQHYRPLTAGEPTPDAGEVPHVKGVRGEIWQEVFDPECGRASFVKFLAYTYLLDNESQDSG